MDNCLNCNTRNHSYFQFFFFLLTFGSFIVCLAIRKNVSTTSSFYYWIMLSGRLFSSSTNTFQSSSLLFFSVEYLYFLFTFAISMAGIVCSTLIVNKSVWRIIQNSWYWYFEISTNRYFYRQSETIPLWSAYAKLGLQVKLHPNIKHMVEFFGLTIGTTSLTAFVIHFCFYFLFLSFCLIHSQLLIWLNLMLFCACLSLGLYYQV